MESVFTTTYRLLFKLSYFSVHRLGARPVISFLTRSAPYGGAINERARFDLDNIGTSYILTFKNGLICFLPISIPVYYFLLCQYV